MRTLRSVGVLVPALACVAAGCKGSSSVESSSVGAPATADAVNVGLIAIVDVAPIYLGRQKGFFSARRIDLTLTPGQGGATTIPGVVSGQFQFGFGNVTSLLIARDKGLPLKILTSGNASTGKQGKDFGAVVVPQDSPIQSAKDLAGKTVSVNQLKNIGDTTVRAAVRAAGGDPAQVRFIELAFPDAPAAIEKKQVDAAWVVEPFLTRVLGQGGRVVAWNFVDTAPDLTVATYFTTEEMVRSKPDLVRRFTEAMNESLTYAQAHPDEARDVLRTYTKMGPEVTARIILPVWPTEVNRASVKKVAELALQDGLIEKPADLDALLPAAR